MRHIKKRFAGRAELRRFVEWGHWGIIFWAGERDARPKAIAQLDFGLGPCGPVDGTLGSPLREAYKTACRDWVKRGELPEGSYCPSTEAWLYDHDNPTPGAKWVDGIGWLSPVRVGRAWHYPPTVGAA